MIGILRRTERLLIGAGISLLAFWVVARVHQEVLSRSSIAAFERALNAAPASEPANRPKSAPASTDAGTVPGSVDFSLWSVERIRGYSESLGVDLAAPLAVLRIPKLGLAVPVLEGTDEITLNRGVGHIADTPVPGVPGNVGIAGHRDGFFRGLKDIAVGDRLELTTKEQVESYRIERITIVPPEEVSVLDATRDPTLTLVTCYPFYFVGSAPLRYIVRAVRTEP